MQGKLEFSVRLAGYVFRRFDYRIMLSRGKIRTEEVMRRFEKLLERKKIPDNLKINNM